MGAPALPNQRYLPDARLRDLSQRVGESSYRYDPFHYLLVTVDLPSVGQTLEASRERPFLSLPLDLPPALVSAVMVEAELASPPRPAKVRAITVSPLDVDLLDAAGRCV